MQSTPRLFGAGGVVLAGGRSSRMGTPKAALDWHGSTLLYRTTALLQRAVSGPVVVVSAPGQELPPLPDGVRVVEDPVEGLGPLQGIAAGLQVVGETVPIAFVTSTDLPFLHPRYVHRVMTSMDDVEVALPILHDHRQPLAAGYRTELGERATELIEKGARTPGELFAESNVRVLDAAHLLADPVLEHVDPDLASVRNINTAEEYEQARSEPEPEITMHIHGTWMDQGKTRIETVRAANIGSATRTMRIGISAALLVTVNSEKVAKEPDVPLFQGDSVAILTSNVGV
ncbi:molybdenum cofactor guanylyltransferase [Sporichthya polymorpha]|uniref:molybdenum cofactor guanylyltransferase n=1 Tax=Sporichthya polymorpha TaxID=35751 RepID=UPI000366EDFF|nr:molybdenum cofactor guanylyltransferase [Sporichthya polymorpha]